MDYYGVFAGRYVAFEVKETSKDHFLFSQIKPHQLNILTKIKGFSGVSFLLLNFAAHQDSCYLIDSGDLRALMDGGKRRITLEEAREVGHHVPILFPGILDFLSPLQHSRLL